MRLTGPTPFGIVSALVVLLVLCGLESVRAQGPIFPFSAPANPWTVEPVEVKATLLLFPWEQEGRHFESYDALATEIQMCFQAAELRQIGVNRQGDPWGHLYAMRVHDGEEGIPVNAGHREVLVRFFGATHSLTGQLHVDDENREWHFHARLDGPALPEPVTQVFKVQTGAIYHLAPQVASWIGGAMGDLLQPDDVQRLGRPLRPERFSGPEDEEYSSLLGLPASPGWNALIEENPDLPMLVLDRATRLNRNQSEELMQSLAAEPLPANSHQFLHMARGYLLHDIAPRAAVHEWEILAARYPGVHGYGARLLDFDVLEGEVPEDSVRRVERWHRLAPPSLFHDWFMASELLRASRALRGGGWAYEIPQENRRKYVVFAEQAIEKGQAIIDDIGPLPLVCWWIMDAMGVAGRPDLIDQVFKQCVKEYPYFSHLYMRYLNFLAPRWYGSEEAMISFIEQTIDRYPNWNYPAALAMTRIWSEASLTVEPSEYNRSADVTADWLESRPGWQAILRKSIDHAQGEDKTLQSLTWAYCYALLLRDQDLMLQILKDHPEFNLELTGSRFHYIPQQRYLLPIAAMYMELGRFENTISAIGRRRSANPSILDPENTHQFNIWAPFQATSLAFLGSPQQSESIWADVRPDHPMQVHRLISWAAANHRIDEVLAEVEPLVAEKPDSIHLVGAYALALAQSGEKEKAREVLSTVPLFEQNERWTYLKDAARRVVLEEE